MHKLFSRKRDSKTQRKPRKVVKPKATPLPPRPKTPTLTTQTAGSGTQTGSATTGNRYNYMFPDATRANSDWAFEHHRRLQAFPTLLPGGLDFIPRDKATKLRVTRGEYSAVVDSLRTYGGFSSIVGPTACGKSTYCLLPILDTGRSVLLVQPSGVNVASGLANFTRKIPATIESRNLPHGVPVAGHNSFMAVADSPCQLNLSTSFEVTQFFFTYGHLPPVDIVVLDEYHLPTLEMTICRMLLRSVKQPVLPLTVFMASATPPDEPPPPVRLDGLTITRVPAIDPLATELSCYLRRETLREFGNNVLLIVVDGCVSAHSLVERLLVSGERCASLCPCLSPEAAANIITEARSRCTLVATPVTEAGLDIDCSHFTTTNEAVRAVYEAGLQLVELRSLADKQAVQRLGRAGRSRHTLVYSASSEAPRGSDDPSPVHCAIGYLIVLASTGSHPDDSDSRVAIGRYARLAKFTQRAAMRCVEAESQLLEAYTINHLGEKYVEFGGKAPGYARDCGADMRLFRWPGGMAFAPYLDLTTYHDPTIGQSIQSVRTMAEEVKERSGLGEVSLEVALGYATDSPGEYRDTIWLGLQELQGESNLYSSTLVLDRSSPRYMLGELGSRWWDLLAADGATVETRFSSVTPGALDRVLRWKSNEINYCSSNILGPDSKVSDKLVGELLYTHLKPVAIATYLRNSSDYCTNLSSYSKAKARSGNSWFRDLKL